MKKVKTNLKRATRRDFGQISGHLSLEIGSSKRVRGEESFSRRSWQFLARGIIRRGKRYGSSPARATLYLRIHPRKACGEGVSETGGCRRIAGEVDGGRGGGGGRRGGSRSMNGSGMRAGYRNGLCQPFVTSRDRGSQLAFISPLRFTPRTLHPLQILRPLEAREQRNAIRANGNKEYSVLYEHNLFRNSCHNIVSNHCHVPV